MSKIFQSSVLQDCALVITTSMLSLTCGSPILFLICLVSNRITGTVNKSGQTSKFLFSMEMDSCYPDYDSTE